MVVGNLVYHIEMTTKGNYLARLDASNGHVVSRIPVENFYASGSGTGPVGGPMVWSALFEGLMSEKISYVFPSVGHLDALSNQTGALLWSIKLAGWLC